MLAMSDVLLQVLQVSLVDVWVVDPNDVEVVVRD